MNKRTPLDNITEGRGRDVARSFFEDYKISNQVTKELYPKAYNLRKLKHKSSFNMPFIEKIRKSWEQEKYIEESLEKIPVITISQKNKSKRYFKRYRGFRLTFAPIIDWIHKQNVELTPTEQDYFKRLLDKKEIRRQITEEYPREDIIQATLKFYVKNFVLKYSFYLSELKNIPESHKEDRKKTRKLKKDNGMMKDQAKDLLKYLEKYRNKEKKLTFDPLKTHVYTNLESPLEFAFSHYYMQFENHPKSIIQFDRKILKALGIYPNIDIK